MSDVVAQVGREVGRVAEQLVEVVPGRVVESEPGCLAELGIEILQALAAQFGLALEHLLFCWRKHAIETPQHGERQDHVLVLAALEGIADQIRDTPKEADDFAMVHRYSLSELLWLRRL